MMKEPIQGLFFIAINPMINFQKPTGCSEQCQTCPSYYVTQSPQLLSQIQPGAHDEPSDPHPALQTLPSENVKESLLYHAIYLHMLTAVQ